MSQAQTMSEMSDRQKEELRAKIKHQVACEERAFRIVERLIDNPNTEEDFQNSLHFLTPSHYADITEERAVSELCGYPLCDKPLGKVPKQKYFISTKTNKVYDIESRKNFCSGKCYKASTHIEQQISTGPVVLRQSQPCRKFDLLPLGMKSGLVGDEIEITKAAEVRKELTQLENLDKYQEKLKQKKQEQEKVKEKSEKNCQNMHDDNKKTVSVDNDLDTEGSVYTLDRAFKEMGIENPSETKDNKKGESVRTRSNLECKSEHLKSGVVDQRDTENDRKKSELSQNEDILSEKSRQETSCSGASKSEYLKEAKQKKVKTEKESVKSKTDYLMQLLDKRKNLLSQMVDIQPNVQTTDAFSDKSLHTKTNVDTTDHTRNKVVKPTDNNYPGDYENKSSFIPNVTEHNTSEYKFKALPEKDKTIERPKTKTKGKQTLETLTDTPKLEKPPNALELIAKSIESWLTMETMDFLGKCDEEDVNEDVSKDKREFEKKYKALEAKVDAQQAEVGDLIGEESMEDDRVAMAAAPMFDFLKQEVDENQRKVGHFMKGDLTYTVQEKDFNKKDTSSSRIVLPTVDKYDQILIRQKIVHDRISKVLPSLLSPLHLLTQDVFTDLRQLICTFNFTNDNILFKPIEWTLVSLILLKLLSRKMTKLQKAFSSPGSEKFFTILLSGIGADLAMLDNIVVTLK